MTLPDTHKMQCAEMKLEKKEMQEIWYRVRIDKYKEVNLIRNENMRGKKNKRNA